MTSIRQRLFIWLLIGLSILWAIAGIGVYLAVKQTELAKLDSELSRMEGSLRFIAMMSQRTRGPVRPDHLITRPTRDNFQSEENRENRENNLSSRRIYKRSGGDPNIGTYRSRLLEES